MSYLDSKQALIKHLKNNLPTGLTTADVAFENKKFNPKGKSLRLAAYFIPVTSEALGKDSASCDVERGIFQISVFVKLNSDQYTNDQLQAIDELKTAFRYNTTLVYNAQTVYISESKVNEGSESEAFYQRDISINYLTFSNRG